MSEKTNLKLPSKLVGVKRSDLSDAWKTNHKEWAAQAREHKMSVAGFLNTICPEEDGSRSIPIALHDIMQKEGLRMASSSGVPSSLIAEFFENDSTLAALAAYVENYYESCMGLSQSGLINAKQAKAGTRSSVGDIPAGNAFNDYQIGVFREQTRRGLKLRLAAILADTEEAIRFTHEIPEYITPPIEEQMSDKAEGTDIKAGTIKVGSRTVRLKKVAVALKYTYEFATGDGLRSQAIRTWTRNTAIQHEKALVKQALRTGLGDYEGSDGATKENKFVNQAADDYDVETLTRLAFELDEDYVADTVIGGPRTLAKWLNIKIDGAGTTLGQYLALNPDFNQPNQNINTAFLLPTQWAAIKEDIVPTADSTATADNPDTLVASSEQLFFFDSMQLINYVTFPAQDVNESHRDPLQQMLYQILSRYYGFYVGDNNARMKVKFDA